MPDIFTPEKRSQVMSLIRGKNTSLERIVFRFLRSRKIYFQKHYKRAAGSPDIALPRKKRAVFIDGDFWHGWDFAKRRAKLEGNGQIYWITKIERNMERDAENLSALEAAGWRVMRVWEHEIRKKSTREEVLDRVMSFLQD